MQTIQMNLSQKRNIFCQLFSPFSKSTLNFKHFRKKLILIASVFPKLPTWKTWLEKRLKAPV